MDSEFYQQVDIVLERLKNARKIFVMTGAGISAESGIPTFRGSEGLWKKYRAEELATPEAFEKNPALVWEWYLWRRSIVEKAGPNIAHEILARWEKKFPEFLIATQNVDGLHGMAGSKNVEEIHGNIRKTRCPQTGVVYGPEEVKIDPEILPPRSPEGYILRPDVVWFGEMLPRAPLDRITSFLSSSVPDVCFVIGTSALFYYIQSWARVTKMNGGLLAEINPVETPLSPLADVCLRTSAVKSLQEIHDHLSR
mgnify:CR=1 FL=1